MKTLFIFLLLIQVLVLSSCTFGATIGTHNRQTQENSVSCKSDSSINQPTLTIR